MVFEKTTTYNVFEVKHPSKSIYEIEQFYEGEIIRDDFGLSFHRETIPAVARILAKNTRLNNYRGDIIITSNQPQSKSLGFVLTPSNDTGRGEYKISEVKTLSKEDLLELSETVLDALNGK